MAEPAGCTEQFAGHDGPPCECPCNTQSRYDVRDGSGNDYGPHQVGAGSTERACSIDVDARDIFESGARIDGHRPCRPDGDDEQDGDIAESEPYDGEWEPYDARDGLECRYEESECIIDPFVAGDEESECKSEYDGN